MRAVAALAVLMVVVAACSETGSGPHTTLHMSAAADSVGIWDTLTVEALRTPFTAKVTWEIRDTMLLRRVRGTLYGGRVTLFAKELGASWIVASAGGVRDSLLLRVVQIPVGESGYTFSDDNNRTTFVDPHYRPVDGMCYTGTWDDYVAATGGPPYWTTLGGWIADRRRDPIYRTHTTWTFVGDSIMAHDVSPDSTNDIRIRPAPNNAGGFVKIMIEDSGYTSEIHVYVDPDNNCAGLIGTLRAARADVRSVTANGVTVYTW